MNAPNTLPDAPRSRRRRRRVPPAREPNSDVYRDGTLGIFSLRNDLSPGLPGAQWRADWDAVERQRDELTTFTQTWNLPLGLPPVRLGPSQIFVLIATFHLGVIGGGIAALFQDGEGWLALGVSLIVGGLLGIGSFLMAVWTRAVEREASLWEGEFQRRTDELARRERALIERTESIRHCTDPPEAP